MKRFYLGLGLLAAVAALSFGCESSSSSGGGLSFAGSASAARSRRWDLLLTNLDMSTSKFTVTVKHSGGSGAAVVSISDEENSYPNETVWNGVAIPLGNCGFTVTFLDTGGMSLVAGDAWVIMIVGGSLGGPAFPTALVQNSTNVAVVPGGTNTCSSTCSTGLFEGLPNFPAAIKKLYPTLPLPNLPFSIGPALEVKTTSYSLEANVPEVYLLSFSTLPSLLGPTGVKSGDKIQVQFTRRITSDHKDGDSFAVRLTNNRNFEFVEDRFGMKMKTGAAETITYTATAAGDFLGLDFIVGLSGPADYVILDDVSITVNGVPLLTENFEGAGLTPGPYLWLDVIPSQALGSAGLTADSGDVIAGAQSFKFQGGRLFHLYGQKAKSKGIEAAEYTLTDGSVQSTYWLGSFLGSKLGGAFAGTYGGKNFDDSCQEKGMFFASVDSPGYSDGSGTWAITVDAKLTHCDPGLSYGETAFPETSYAVNVLQFQTAPGGVLQGATVISDSLGDKVKFTGMVLGDIFILEMTVSTPMLPGGMVYSGAFEGTLTETDTGAVSAGTLTGVASPNVLFPPDTCELTGSFTATITRP
jgi:hypothetical protein